MIGLDRSGTRRGAVDRRADRLVAVVSVVVALAYLCAAVVAAFLPASLRIGAWLPIHLALAGGASTAIAGVMPFFSAAFAAAQPVAARIRWAALLSVAVGALAVTAGYVDGWLPIAALGGTLFMVGLALTAYATVAPTRRGLGPWGGAVTIGYVAALTMVVGGAFLGTLYMARWQPILEAWSVVRPAHAWLNLVGFVSLVIATTLLHFFPTVIGARMQRTPSAILTVAGIAAGSAVVALGFLQRSDVLVRVGAVLVLAGALSLAVYAARVWRTRARWSGDAAWHRFAIGGLVSAIVWFELGTFLATGRLLLAGADPAAATATVLVGPLVLGWVGLAILASATHLVPAIGPGDPAAHAAQRVLLGRGATARLVSADLAIALLALGLWPGVPEQLAVVGTGLAAISLGVTVALLLGAIGIGIRSASATGQLRA
jgi:hypothetical protein